MTWKTGRTDIIEVSKTRVLGKGLIKPEGGTGLTSKEEGLVKFKV